VADESTKSCAKAMALVDSSAQDKVLTRARLQASVRSVTSYTSVELAVAMALVKSSARGYAPSRDKAVARARSLATEHVAAWSTASVGATSHSWMAPYAGLDKVSVMATVRSTTFFRSYVTTVSRALLGAVGKAYGLRTTTRGRDGLVAQALGNSVVKTAVRTALLVGVGSRASTSTLVRATVTTGVSTRVGTTVVTAAALQALAISWGKTAAHPSYSHTRLKTSVGAATFVWAHTGVRAGLIAAARSGERRSGGYIVTPRTMAHSTHTLPSVEWAYGDRVWARGVEQRIDELGVLDMALSPPRVSSGSGTPTVVEGAWIPEGARRETRLEDGRHTAPARVRGEIGRFVPGKGHPQAFWELTVRGAAKVSQLVVQLGESSRRFR